MLIKILFTVVVIIGVVIFFRHRQSGGAAVRGGRGQRSQRGAPAATAAAEDGKSVSPRVVAYGLLGALLVVSVLIVAFNWHASNRIVTIRVIADGATTAHYQARHKSIKGRTFTTLQGARITLGESDRIEMLEP